MNSANITEKSALYSGKPQNAPGKKAALFSRIVLLFAIGSFLGYVIEVLYCLVVHGFFESKQAMVIGPFNQIYGVGAVLIDLCLRPLAKKGLGYVFVAGAIGGGLFEYTCSLLQEAVFKTRSWNFKNTILTIQGRTGLVYMIFWGILSVACVRLVIPLFNRLMTRIPGRPAWFAATFMAVFFILNMALSASVVFRWVDRQRGQPPSGKYEQFLDRHYSDQKLDEIFSPMELLE